MTRLPTDVTDMQIIRSHARRNGIQLRHSSTAHSSAAIDLTSSARARKGRLARDHAAISEPIGKEVKIPLEDVDKPSTDLRRPLRGILLKLKRFPGWIVGRWLILHPPLTPDQVEERAALALEKARDKLCRREARIYARRVSQKLAQLGLRELLTSPSQDKPRKLKLCRWRLVTRDALFTKIVMVLETDPRSLPSYVQVSKLAKDPLYSDELLPTINHYVRWDSSDAAVTLTIFRHGLDGLPDFVTAEDIWKKIPENKPPLTFPVGYGANSERVDVDLDDCPHLIVAGATKQGKSNFINQMICFWLWRGLSPQDLQLVLFDLKRGLEFTFYEGLPHLYRDTAEEVNSQHGMEFPAFIETGIIEELPQVMAAMRRLRQLMDHRLLLIKNAKHKDFNGYNRAQHSRQKRLPAMVVIFDEWARIRLKLHNEAEDLLAEMTNLARAAGMYFILGTQNPNREVIGSLIGVNFSTRVVFKCSVGGSMAALGDQAAVGLDEKGRAILQDGGDEKKLQTPRITDSLIRAVVYKATTGKEFKGRIASGTDLVEILEYALDHMDGSLDVLKLYTIFREKNVRKNWLIDALRDAEGQEFILSGKSYRVSPRGNHTARQLIQNI